MSIAAHPITNTADARAFINGGNATVTLRSNVTGNRFTYKVSTPKDKATGKPEAGNKRFVSLLAGADNTGDFVYLGMVGDDGVFRATRATRHPDSMSFRAFAWAWAKLARETMPEGLEVWHEGKCGRCGRKLTVPESIANGFGPECVTRIMLGGIAREARAS